jgi:hypothetical protein
MSAIVAIVLANRRRRNRQKLLRTASTERRKRAETRADDPLDTEEQVRFGGSWGAQGSVATNAGAHVRGCGVTGRLEGLDSE